MTKSLDRVKDMTILVGALRSSFGSGARVIVPAW